MVTFGERIRALANAIGKDEQDIAKDLGLTKSRMSHYITGRSRVPSDMLQKIVSMYDINPTYLFKEDAPLYDVIKEVESVYTTGKNKYPYIPAAISAGLPIDVAAVTDAKQIEIPNELMGRYAGHKDVVILRINGDSMDKLMLDGSLIAIKPITLDMLKDDDIVVYSVNGEYSVKHYYKQDDLIIFRPNSNNKSHHDQVFKTDEKITIHGKVIMWTVTVD